MPSPHLTSILCCDALCNTQAVRKMDLQLVGISCMWIAAKYEEQYPPTSQQMAGITDDTYTTLVRKQGLGFKLRFEGASHQPVGGCRH
jgi:hypothetical protein